MQRIIYIEDNEKIGQHYYDAMSEHYNVTWHREWKGLPCKPFAAAVVDLKLGDDPYGGQEALDELEQLGIPTVVMSNYPTSETFKKMYMENVKCVHDKIKTDGETLCKTLLKVI